MAENSDPKHLDKRTVERYLRSGQLDEKVYERHLKSLPDVADKSAVVETAMMDKEAEDESEEDGAEA